MAETNEESTPATLLRMTEQVRQKNHGTPSNQSSGRGSSVGEAPVSDSRTPETPQTPEVFETSSNTEFYTRVQSCVHSRPVRGVEIEWWS